MRGMAEGRWEASSAAPLSQVPRYWKHSSHPSPWPLPSAYYSCPQVAPSLTFVPPDSKEGEDRGAVVSDAAQTQRCAVFERERGTRGEPQRERDFPVAAWSLWPHPTPGPQLPE